MTDPKFSFFLSNFLIKSKKNLQFLEKVNSFVNFDYFSKRA